MRRKVRKIAVGFLVIMLIMSFSLPAFAADANQVVDKKSYDDICKEYNLKTVTEVPEGVQPVEVKSEEELLNLLTAFDNMSSDAKIITNKSNITIQGTRDILVDSYNWGIGSVNLYARVTDNGYRVTGASAYTVVEGFTPGLSWREITKGARIVYNGTAVEAWATGQLDYYLIIEGGVKVYSKKISLSDTVYIFFR